MAREEMFKGMTVDYSMVAGNSTGRVRFANRFAERTLRAGRPRCGTAFGAGGFGFAEVVAAGGAEAAAEAESALEVVAGGDEAGEGGEQDGGPEGKRKR